MSQHHGGLDAVFKFADISRPWIVKEQPHGLRAERFDVFALLCGITLKEIAGLQRNVIFSLFKRRQINRNHVKPIIEILTKSALFYRLQKVSVGGRNDTHIHGQGAFPADAFKLLGLDNPQKLDLGRWGNFADFIQENGSAIGLLKAPDLLPDGTGEGPLFVTEKLTFKQSSRIGGAVNNNERGVFAKAALMNGASYQVLDITAAGTGAGNHHGTQELVLMINRKGCQAGSSLESVWQKERIDSSFF